MYFLHELLHTNKTKICLCSMSALCVCVLPSTTTSLIIIIALCTCIPSGIPAVKHLSLSYSIAKSTLSHFIGMFPF
jgi:hypothetical protein